MNAKASAVNWPVVESAIQNWLQSNGIRNEITLELAPAPGRLATHALTLLADLDIQGEEVGSGRLVVLFEPQWQEAWDGNLRLVAFARAELETELVTDPMLLEVGWSWVEDSFTDRKLDVTALSGTISRAGSQSFGDLANRSPEGSVEIRYSWTVPNSDQIVEHLQSWCDLLAAAAGLEPLPPGVSTIRPKARQ